MADAKRKILVLVEGEKTDVALMEHLLSVYQFDLKYEVVSYRTNIYTLYHEMFESGDPSDMDLLQLLKSREPDPGKKTLFDDVYSDILLIFDLDPQAPDFSPEKISSMAAYFVESSDMGKLYLNYPMVEAFYHMTSIPDPRYDSYYANLDELLAGGYKARVGRENRDHDYRKFAKTKDERSIVIQQNMEKAWQLVGRAASYEMPPPQSDVLAVQLNTLSLSRRLSVLSTCAFFIPEYNPRFISAK